MKHGGAQIITKTKKKKSILNDLLRTHMPENSKKKQPKNVFLKKKKKR